MPSMKAIKGGKTENEFDERSRTLRGTTYTIRELSLPEYKECLKAATKEDGTTPFQDLLDIMVMRCVKPSPATRSKPMPYSVYRTLEDEVNLMHFRTLPDDKEPDDEESETPEADEEAEAEAVAAPNS